jgi:hypothetical protein
MMMTGCIPAFPRKTGIKVATQHRQSGISLRNNVGLPTNGLGGLLRSHGNRSFNLVTLSMVIYNLSRHRACRSGSFLRKYRMPARISTARRPHGQHLLLIPGVNAVVFALR